jgi:hypothetical protein
MRNLSIAILSLAALAASAPISRRALHARQNGGPVLADTTYNDISISGGGQRETQSKKR